MAEQITVARPYAQALFKHAQEKGQLKDWSEILGVLATIAKDENMQLLLTSAHVTKDQCASLFIDIGGKAFPVEAQNFIKILAENHRLLILGEIATLYEQYRAEAESTVQAQVISAFPVDTNQRQKIAKALSKRLGREVHLECLTDDSLVGGAIIRAGDLVIDGSVNGKLEKLAVTMNH